MTHQTYIERREAGPHVLAVFVVCGAVLDEVYVGHALQRTRAIRPGGAAREPEDGEQGGEDEVGHRELRLVLVHLVHKSIDRDDEETIQHREHTSGNEELAVRTHIRRDVDGLSTHRSRRAHLLREAERVVNDRRHVGRLATLHRHLQLKVGGRGKGADCKNLERDSIR